MLISSFAQLGGELVAPAPAAVRSTDHSPFARDLVAAFAVKPHAISPKYFYDAAGSHLFDRICELPEMSIGR